MSQETTFRAKAPWIMEKLLADFPIGIEDAAAIVGNLGHESGGFTLMQELKPTVAGSRGGYGWAQWTGPRRRAFEAYCERNGLEPSSDKANYAWLFLELKGEEKRAISAVVNGDGLDEKVEAFERAYERAGVKHYPSRKVWARRALEAWEARPDLAAAPVPTPRPEPIVVIQEPAMPSPIGHNGGPPLDKPLTPIEQMNKPVQGAKAGLGASTLGGAVVLLLASAGWLPEAWQSGEAAIALGLVAGTLATAIGNFIGSYMARDKRFQPEPSA